MKKISLIVSSVITCLLVFDTVYGQDNQNTTNSVSSGLTITTDGVTSNSADTTNKETDDGEESQQNLGSAYVCSLNGLQRRIEIDLLSAPAPVPCEVNYYKDNEAPGAKATLWSANNDGQYCEHQAKNLVEKLESMNWSCSGG